MKENNIIIYSTADGKTKDGMVWMNQNQIGVFQMNKYDKYKDSGIDWIGEIPEHWSDVSIKWISSIFAGGTPSKDKHEYWYNGNIPWLNSGTVNQCYITEPSELITELGFEKSSAKWIPKEALVVALAGQGRTKGMVAQLGFNATCNQSMAAIVLNRIIQSRYLLYWLQNNYQNIRNLGGGDLRDGLNLEMIGSIKCPIPNDAEQTAIASYLDRKTAEIDELIADKKRLLELYEEEKTAIINQAVTKGINPDVKMKDSGIEWLGEIPAHWEVKRLKYVASIVLGKMLTPEDKGGYQLKPYLRAANLGWIHVNVEDVKEMWFSDREIEKYRIKKNDLLVSEGGEVGRTCIWNDELKECYIQNSVHKVTVNDKCDSRYFLKLFYLYGNKGAFDLIVNRISIAHLTVEKLKEVEFIVPSRSEQTSIVHHIETQCSRVNAKKNRTEKLIALLTEYRAALISEVVTGKIKVVD
ncbi:MAG: restriction endonuclease subunit S [Spirochaetales bacterium]|nr:restriction endonuclease subunit S [Spirochaetales bacterium]